jgi:hypothetical protein
MRVKKPTLAGTRQRDAERRIEDVHPKAKVSSVVTETCHAASSPDVDMHRVEILLHQIQVGHSVCRKVTIKINMTPLV